MGWSFRKSLKMGPIRLNLSKSGIGISAGIKGARISVGPRGTYVTLSGGGFRYQKKLDASSRPRAQARPQIVDERVQSPSHALVENEPGFLATASVADLQQSSAADTLHDIQQRASEFNWFALYVVAASALTVWVLITASSPVFVWACALGLTLLGLPVQAWSSERRTARLLYDVDDPAAMERFMLAASAGESLARASSIWHVYSSINTTDWKRNAGASALLRRIPVQCVNRSLPHIESNILPWSIPAGPQQLMFLPDQLLVYEQARFAGVPYDQLSVEVAATQFIEEAPVPPDAQQVSTTWRFVNKTGGPDRRFKDNRQLPIMQYGELIIRSGSGINIIFHISNLPAARDAINALRALITLTRKGDASVSDQPRATLPAPARPSLPPAHSLPGVTPPALPAAPSPPKAMPGPDLADPMAQAVALVVMLKYVALADRRFTAEERAKIQEAVRLHFSGAASVLNSIGAMIEQLRPTPEMFQDSMQFLCSLDLPARTAMCALASGVALADGKITPKERERLQEIAAVLGVALSE